MGCLERKVISIHALRVEGDLPDNIVNPGANKFLSTPSGWRATKEGETFGVMLKISIHALRVEGDRRASTEVSS